MTNQVINIRPMSINDYESVIRIWSDAEGMTLREADSREAIARYLQHNPGFSFVAEAEDSLVGAVLVGTDGRRGYLQHLAVLPDYQGMGIGKNLIQSATLALQQAGIAKTHLFVHLENQTAQAFYLKHGWQARDEVRMFSFNGSDNPEV